MAITTTRAKGQHSEGRAAAYLQARGYTILGMNWRCKAGEIDIIAREGATLVFVEVRSRRTIEAAFESISPRKRARLTRAVYSWLAEHTHDDPAWRIDVIAVGKVDGKAHIDHRQDALDW